jgi:hypothetical protein
VRYRQVQATLEWYWRFINPKSERICANFGRFGPFQRDGRREAVAILPTLLIEE